MDAASASNVNSKVCGGESVLKKLRKKYSNRAKRIKRPSYGTKMISTSNLDKHSSHSDSHCVVPLGYKRKIQDLLVNNSELAKSLESARLENCRLEKDNSLFQRQLNLRPIVESKLMEVSTNLSLAASLISETVSMIMEARQFLLGENMIDTVLTTDSLSKSDDSQRFSHRTPEDQPIPGPSSRADTWQPCQLQALDMSTIAEVSVMCDETRNLLNSGITPTLHGLSSVEELNSNTPEIFMKVTNDRIASIAEATEQKATPENKELEPSDETPKTPVLLSQKLFPSLIPKAVVQCLPFKKRVSYSENHDEDIPMISLDVNTKNVESITDVVSSRRETGKFGKTKPENANKAIDNKNSNYHKPDNMKATPVNESDCTVTAASSILDTGSQITDPPLNRHTVNVQNKISFPGMNSISENSPDFSKKKRSTTTKNISAKNKSRRNTYLVSKNDDHQIVPNTSEDALDLMASQTASVSQKLKITPKNASQIQKEMPVHAPIPKKIDNSVSDTKNEKFANCHSSVSVFENIPLLGNSCLPNIAPDTHDSSKLNEQGEELKPLPNETTFNFIDMSLTEVIPVYLQATVKEDNPNMQISEHKKANLKPELAINGIAADKNVQLLEDEQEMVEKHSINPKLTPLEENAQSKKNTLDTLENDDGVDQTKKLKDKKYEKKPKKVSSSKSNKKDAKDRVPSRTKKNSLKDKAANKKGKVISPSGSLPSEVASSLLLLPSQKRKSSIHEIYDDGLNVVSPRKAEEMGEGEANNIQENCSPSTSSKNRNSESLKSIENVQTDNNFIRSPKRMKLEIKLERKSFIVDLSTKLDPPKMIELCRQPGTSGRSSPKDLDKVTKTNKKSNSKKNKKTKPDSAASDKKKLIGRPKTKGFTESEKENGLVHLSDMSDFYSPIPKVKVTKPPKKRGRSQKSPLKSQNTDDTKPLIIRENIANSHSNTVTVQSEFDPIIQVDNIFLPIQENLGPDYLSSSFELKSNDKILKITSPTTGCIELALPQLEEKSVDTKPDTPKASKNSVTSRYTKSVSMEKTQPSVSSSITDSAPRRRRQAVSYREPSLHSKLRRG